MGAGRLVDLRSIIAAPSRLPALVWNYYLEYLWYYQSNSWVARIAYAFRVLAFLLILPVAILTLLDIASYVVARTLGVVDDVKASTSDVVTTHVNPIVIVEDTSISTPTASLSSSGTLVETSLDKKERLRLDTDISSTEPDSYFTSEENKLSGFGVFSPATSQPPSPTLTRRNLPSQEPYIISDGNFSRLDDDLGSLRRRTTGVVAKG